MISVEELKRLIEDGIPGAHVEVTDEANDGEHFRAVVLSETFAGLGRLEQHQKVYAALGDAMQGRIHALALKTGVVEKEG